MDPSAILKFFDLQESGVEELRTRKVERKGEEFRGCRKLTCKEPVYIHTDTTLEEGGVEEESHVYQMAGSDGSKSACVTAALRSVVVSYVKSMLNDHTGDSRGAGPLPVEGVERATDQ